MSLFGKAKHAAQEFQENWQASGRRMDEDAARRPKPQPAKPSAADQQLQRDAETVIRNQQMGLTD